MNDLQHAFSQILMFLFGDQRRVRRTFWWALAISGAVILALYFTAIITSLLALAKTAFVLILIFLGAKLVWYYKPASPPPPPTRRGRRR